MPEKEAAQASSAEASIDGQPGEQDNRHGVPRKLLGLYRRQAFSVDRPAGQGVRARPAYDSEGG
jgi:hypothetical protein